MKPVIKVSRKNAGVLKQLAAQVEKQRPRECAVGFPVGMANAVDADGVTALQKAVWNNNGADINHPGGTPYKREMTNNGAAWGGGTQHEVRFVKKSSPGASKLPVTKPHKITIPARPFADLAAMEIREKWPVIRDAAVRKAIREKTFIDVDAVLDAAGVMGTAEFQRAIDNMVSPKNADSTIRKKGSSHPLIDSGNMKQSVTFVVRDAGSGGEKA